MPATVTSFEDHRSLVDDLSATEDWLLIKQAAVDGFLLQIAIGESGAAQYRALGREDVAATYEDRVRSLRRALARAEAWNPMTDVPQRIR